jgi:hypothetical protein
MRVLILCRPGQPESGKPPPAGHEFSRWKRFVVALPYARRKHARLGVPQTASSNPPDNKTVVGDVFAVCSALTNLSPRVWLAQLESARGAEGAERHCAALTDIRMSCLHGDITSKYESFACPSDISYRVAGESQHLADMVLCGPIPSASIRLYCAIFCQR